MTSRDEKRIPIFGGRWQPFHKGHAHLLERMLKEYSQVIVAIVNPDPDNPASPNFERFQSEANPLTYWERYWLFRGWAEDLNVTDRTYFVPTWHPRISVEREAFFMPPQRRRLWWVPDIDESEGAKVADFRRLGEMVKVVEDVPAEDLSFNSTVLRRNMRAGLEWRHSVPAAVASRLESADFKALRWECSGNIKFALFAGRFQPLHNGHLDAIEAALQTHDVVVVGIQCDEVPVADPLSPSHPAHNPFNYWQRLGMVHAALREKQISSRVYVVPLWLFRDGRPAESAYIPARRAWLVPDRGHLAAEHIASLTNAGEDVEVFTTPNRWDHVLGAEVRYEMVQGKKWVELVPAAVSRIIEGTYGTSQVIGLARRYPDEVANYLSMSRRRLEGDEEAGLAETDRELQRRLRELEDIIGENIISRQQLVGRLGPKINASQLDLPLWRKRRASLDAIRQSITDDVVRSGSPSKKSLLRLDGLGYECFGEAWNEADNNAAPKSE
jgi:nicotinamide-nucleotide adenylyltransferase